MLLHRINNQIEHLLGTAVDQETGEISPETEAALTALELDRDARVLDLAVYALGLEREAEAVNDRADELSRRADILSNKARSLISYIERHVAVGEKLRDDRVSIGWRKSTRVEITDSARIADCYQREIPRRFEPDKPEIKKAIERGEDVEGALLATYHKLKVE